MGSNDVELVRLRGADRWIRLGIAAAGLLVLVATIKPWSGLGAPGPINSPSPRLLAVDAATGIPSPSAAPPDAASALCPSPDAWLIVADDLEFGQPVRTWLVAGVEYSADRPAPSTIPVTTIVSAGVRGLSFCLPAGSVAQGNHNWSGTLWLADAGPASGMQWRVDAEVSPASGAPGAPANPVSVSASAWPPGLYYLEVRFAGLTTEAWLGVRIRGGPSA